MWRFEKREKERGRIWRFEKRKGDGWGGGAGVLEARGDVKVSEKERGWVELDAGMWYRNLLRIGARLQLLLQSINKIWPTLTPTLT